MLFQRVVTWVFSKIPTQTLRGVDHMVQQQTPLILHKMCIVVYSDKTFLQICETDHANIVIAKNLKNE